MDTFLRRQFTGLLLICGLFAAATPHAALAAGWIQTGCPWFKTSDFDNDRNHGFPDKNATYWLSHLASTPEIGSQIVISGTFPQLRFMSFSVYGNGGRIIDHIADARIYPAETNEINPDIAALPLAIPAQNTYSVTIKFVDVVPDQRDPNTIYVQVDPSKTVGYKLYMRGYLPDAGADLAGNVGLPSLTYEGPLGTVDLNVGLGKDLERCTNYYTQLENNPKHPNLPPLYVPTKPVMKIGTFTVPIANVDAGYVYANTKETYSDMVIVRGLAPVTPLTPNAQTLPQVRYWSLCQDSATTSAALTCLPDRDVVIQDDGYFNIVISADEKRPELADTSFGYNWISWGSDPNGYILMRQILAAPDFPGNYAAAAAGKFLPSTKVLGVWAPTISYCDSTTFADNAASGGATLFAACQAAYNQTLATSAKNK